MIKIYCITDINGLNYVGKTTKSLNQRLSVHRSKKKRGEYCSSQKLDLYNCKMIVLEQCDNNISKQREQYWIDNIVCVNKYNTTFNTIEYMKQYRIKNKDNTKKYNNQRYIDNRDKIKEQTKQYREYQNSWGGYHRTNNNLLKIDPYLFIY